MTDITPTLYTRKVPEFFVIDDSKHQEDSDIWLELVMITDEDINYTEFYLKVSPKLFNRVFRIVTAEEIDNQRNKKDHH